MRDKQHWLELCEQAAYARGLDVTTTVAVFLRGEALHFLNVPRPCGFRWLDSGLCVASGLCRV
jgi:hypothetical protein